MQFCCFSRSRASATGCRGAWRNPPPGGGRPGPGRPSSLAWRSVYPQGELSGSQTEALSRRLGAGVEDDAVEMGHQMRRGGIPTVPGVGEEFLEMAQGRRRGGVGGAQVDQQNPGLGAVPCLNSGSGRKKGIRYWPGRYGRRRAAWR